MDISESTRVAMRRVRVVPGSKLYRAQWSACNDCESLDGDGGWIASSMPIFEGSVFEHQCRWYHFSFKH